MIKPTDIHLSRSSALHAWMAQQSPVPFVWETMPYDCSFRRYHRLHHPGTGETSILMDAPPEEDTEAFIKIARVFEARGLWVPHIYAADIESGFAWLSDLGTQAYPQVLTAENASALYTDALRALIPIHTCTELEMPIFGEAAVAQELAAFQTWFLEAYAGLTVTPGMKRLLKDVQNRLTSAIIAQPQVLLHRDYHAGNLQYSATRNPGILDFQGAMMGPITYDAVSLLRDSRIRWPEEIVDPCILTFKQLLDKSGLLFRVSMEEFHRWFDLTGLELHLKILFIFTRKHCRDQHSSYLQYLPNLLAYIQAMAERHTDFKPIVALVEDAMGRR